MTTGSNRDDAQARLWDAIEARRIGMLSLSKSGQHPQPMIAFVERRRKRLWFIARSDTDLAQTIGEGGASTFVMQDGDVMASVGGALHVVHDLRRLRRYWNSQVAAWLPEGLDDPRLVMLRMDCVDAEVWVAGVGLTKFAWEIAGPGGRPRADHVEGWIRATLH